MKVTGLFLHPIKSCRGIRVDEARVTDRGLEHDRRFMVVDADGTFVTQRTELALARVETKLSAEHVEASVSGFGSVRVPLRDAEGPYRDVVVWRSEVRARAHEAGSAFFTELLGKPSALVHMPDDVVRGVNPKYGRETDRTSFSDGYPFLLLSQASLDDLTARVGAPMVVERFRTNLLIDGDAPFVEDRMGTFTLGDVRFHGVKPCERCVITTIDPNTLDKGKEPLRTLAKYRRNAEGGVLFGMNLVHDGVGSVRVGDVVVMERYIDPS